VRCARLVIALLPAAALPAAEQHDHAAMGQDHAAISRGQPVLGSSTYTATDLKFLAHMIVHHRQALELCEWVPARSDRAEFQAFARYLHDAQQNEIAMMQALLDQAASRGATIPPQHLDGDPPMTGMLSRAQMAAIAAARGREFERLWLEGMIRHHQGGVAMAMGQQVAQHASGNQPWGVDVLVDDMLTVQRAEIGKMQEWLSTWMRQER
jgi:uncharacterized protein (DUF305 family)